MVNKDSRNHLPVSDEYMRVLVEYSINTCTALDPGLLAVTVIVSSVECECDNVLNRLVVRQA